MKKADTMVALSERVRQFVRRDFLTKKPHFGGRTEKFASHPVWGRLRELGTELWLDTGDIDAVGGLWTREFTALTTNNTLLNREVQKGVYDELIPLAAAMLDGCPGMTDQRRRLELAFVLNATHGLRLVERFDARVSVEEHTDLAHDLPAAVDYARRYHEICPERFIVKIPFTAAGLLATRRLSDEGVAVNQTLGFSARQNYLMARIAHPRYVNVFLGRLNAFVADNGLGDGTYVGERATLASQTAVRRLRETREIPTQQIAASFRSAGQVPALAGIDVMTIPPKVAEGFLELGLAPEEIADRTGERYVPQFAEGVDPEAIGLDTLWEVGDELIACVDELERENLDSFTPDDLLGFFDDRGCGDLLVRWSDSEIATSRAEGKIPKLDNWSEQLKSRRIGLDSLFNLAGLNSFAADQQAMDERVRTVLSAK